MGSRKINQSMELCKFIASIFVVFIHVRFPDDFGNTINACARFAVPTFFAISGYFSYGINCERVKKRLAHIFKINVYGTVVYLLWAIYYTAFVSEKDIWQMLASKFTYEKASKWIIMNINPFSGHLWYLSAILVCYLILWIYVRFFGEEKVNYNPLYILSFGMLLFQLAFGVFSKAIGQEFHHTLYRNALFFGMPMFSMGMFIRENSERITDAFHMSAKKAAFLVAAGTLLSVTQWKGIGKEELPVGALVVSVVLMVFMVQNPEISFLGEKGDRTVLFLGKSSLIVYIIHILYNNIFKAYLENYDEVSATFGYPLLILGLSLVTGFVWTFIASFAGKMKISIVRDNEG